MDEIEVIEMQKFWHHLLTTTVGLYSSMIASSLDIVSANSQEKI